jgi:hypothetical protein
MLDREDWEEQMNGDCGGWCCDCANARYEEDEDGEEHLICRDCPWMPVEVKENGTCDGYQSAVTYEDYIAECWMTW